MHTHNQALLDTIIEYSNQAHVDYACMIDGSWGAGKSFFIRKHLIPNLVKLSKNCIYVSANGITNIDQLHQKIFFTNIFGEESNIGEFISCGFSALDGLSKLIPKEIGGTIVSAVTKTLTSIKTPLAKKTVDMFSSNDTIIFIDDVERMSEKTETIELFGQIFASYIDKGYKVVFICNKSKIPENSKFNEISEKHIRWTLKYVPIVLDFARNYLAESSNKLPYLNKSFLEHITPAIDVLKIDNLRTWKLSFDVINRIIKALREANKTLSRDQYITVLFSTLFIVNENRLGELTNVDDCRGVDDVFLSKVVFNSKKDEKAELPYPIKFFDKYCRTTGVDFVYFKTIFQFVLSGLFNEQAFVEEINRKYLEKPEEAVVYDRFLYYAEIEEVEFKSNLDKLICFISEGVYGIGELTSIFQVLPKLHNLKYISDEKKFQIDEILESAFIFACEKYEQHANIDILRAPFEQSIGSTAPAHWKNIIGAVDKKINRKRNDHQISLLFENLGAQDNTVFASFFYKFPFRYDLFTHINNVFWIDKIIQLKSKALSRLEYIAEDRCQHSGITSDERCSVFSVAQKLKIILSNIPTPNNKQTYYYRYNRLQSFIDKISQISAPPASSETTEELEVAPSSICTDNGES